MKLKFIFAFVVFYLSSTCAVSYANEYLENIIQSCSNDGSIRSVGFGDIKTKTASHEGESSYYVDKEYMNDEYYKRSKDYEKIWFYSTIQKNALGKTPKYIWHVIAIPSEIQRQHNIRGYMSADTIDEAVKINVITKRQILSD